ncbi:uncharacterized protein LOC144625123 [Crassostrea virginica]
MASKRKPNWTIAEIEALTQAVSDNIRTVKGKFTPSLTQDTKNRCWRAISERVNAVSEVRACRDITEVKKKWQDLSSITKKKEAERRRYQGMTGGGPALGDGVKPWEQLIIGTFTKSALEGVEGGIDTGKLYSSSQILSSSEREISYPFEDENVQLQTVQPALCSPVDNRFEETSEEFETVIFANSLPTADGAASNTCSQNKRKRRSCNYDENEESKVKLEFLSLEKRKMEEQRTYREKKLALYEKFMKQQSEILELQKRSTIAVELLATKFQLQPPVSPPFSVSPVIRFDTSSCI